MTEEQQAVFENVMKILEREFANDVEVMTYKDKLRAKLLSLYEANSTMDIESAVINMFGDFLDGLPNSSPDYIKFNTAFTVAQRELSDVKAERDFEDWLDSAVGNLRPDQLVNFTKEELKKKCRDIFSQRREGEAFLSLLSELESGARGFVADQVHDEGDYRRIIDLIDFNLGNARHNFYFELHRSVTGADPDKTELAQNVSARRKSWGPDFNDAVSKLDLSDPRNKNEGEASTGKRL